MGKVNLTPVTTSTKLPAATAPLTPTWRHRAGAPVDGGSAAVLRVALGAVAVLAAVRTWWYGWTDTLYAGPSHRFTYLGLEWVPQPGPLGIRVLVVVVAVAGVGVAIGWRTRAAAAALLVAWGWIEAIDVTTYLNHYWFVTLLAAVAAAAPLGAAYSLDARRRGSGPGIAAIWVWLLRFQVGIVYVSAGVAKLQGDWLLRALPLRLWLPARDDAAIVGPLLRWPETAHAASIAGAAFDCLVVPALLWRRTRPFAYAAVVAFHVITWSLFPIGVFPWLMIAAATIFFEPDWPRRAVHRVGRALARRVDPLATRVPTYASHDGRRLVPVPALFAAGLWAAVQIVLPLRHLAYPGDHRWTGEGYRFGWNVLLVERSGSVAFIAHDPATGDRWVADPARLYTPTQLRVMQGEPDLIAQAARAVADDAEQHGHPGVQVTVDAWMSWNGRPAARWIDPRVDLAAAPRTLWHKEWILPAP